MRFYFLALATLLVVCVGCAYDGQQILQKHEYTAPPAAMLANPGPMVGGPGPGVLGMLSAPPAPVLSTTQVRFLGPEGMAIGWLTMEGFAENQLTAPDRYNFPQGVTYRLKLSGIPGRETTLYPTLHVYPTQPTTDAYLSHNALPVRLTDEDLNQVETNNFVTKVIYLPDAKHQELAVAGVEELVSTRLSPGLDPVAEADRRGTIMAVVRIGNMDLEMPAQMGGALQQTSYQAADGQKGQFAPPLPIGHFAHNGSVVPGDMMMGGPAGPGQPAYDPILAQGGAMQYGMPYTSTPIGLAGPPHLPLGRPAGLQSHTVRNLTDVNMPRPTKDMLIDVKHEPGMSLPPPVSHIQYTETHPQYRNGEVSWPAWANGGPNGAPQQYAPPQQ